jgi:enoyl-CoA hydratase
MIERSEIDGIVTLRLAHRKASALDIELCDELRRQLDASRGAGAVILTGSGNIFSAGVDLFRLVDGGAPYVERFYPALREMLELLFTFPRPVVAAANGHAIAGGCLIVAACDYRLMSAGKIGMPELLVGVPLPAIAAEILQFAAGRDAQWLTYTGGTVAPDEALQRGLIDEVVAPDLLMTRAMDTAKRMAAVPADAFRITKLQFRRRGDLDREAVAVWSRPDIHAHIREYLSVTVRKK